MAKKKEFSPRQSIEALIAKIRKGRGGKYRHISDEELFSILLDGYELGCGDTMSALQTDLSKASGAVSKSRKLEKRLGTLEAAVRAQQPSANDGTVEPS